MEKIIQTLIGAYSILDSEHKEHFVAEEKALKDELYLKAVENGLNVLSIDTVDSKVSAQFVTCIDVIVAEFEFEVTTLGFESAEEVLFILGDSFNEG